MKDKIETRIQALREFVEIIEIICEAHGSGVEAAMQNEINFLESILKEIQ